MNTFSSTAPGQRSQPRPRRHRAPPRRQGRDALRDRAVSCAGPGVILDTKWQGMRLFLGEGLFLLRVTGEGDLFASYGGIHEIDVARGYVCDTGTSSFTDGLDYRVRPSRVSRVCSSGEGLVCEFSGRGQSSFRPQPVHARDVPAPFRRVTRASSRARPLRSSRASQVGKTGLTAGHDACFMEWCHIATRLTVRERRLLNWRATDGARSFTGNLPGARRARLRWLRDRPALQGHFLAFAESVGTLGRPWQRESARPSGPLLSAGPVGLHALRHSPPTTFRPGAPASRATQRPLRGRLPVERSPAVLSLPSGALDELLRLGPGGGLDRLLRCNTATPHHGRPMASGWRGCRGGGLVTPRFVAPGHPENWGAEAVAIGRWTREKWLRPARRGRSSSRSPHDTRRRADSAGAASPARVPRRARGRALREEAGPPRISSRNRRSSMGRGFATAVSDSARVEAGRGRHAGRRGDT